MSLVAKEIIDFHDGIPSLVYCEEDQNKFIASYIKFDKDYVYYVLYPIDDRNEYDEDKNWREFADAHVAKNRVNHMQIDWEELIHEEPG